MEELLISFSLRFQITQLNLTQQARIGLAPSYIGSDETGKILDPSNHLT
jgi:hypothetical protein